MLVEGYVNIRTSGLLASPWNTTVLRHTQAYTDILRHTQAYLLSWGFCKFGFRLDTKIILTVVNRNEIKHGFSCEIMPCLMSSTYCTMYHSTQVFSRAIQQTIITRKHPLLCSADFPLLSCLCNIYRHGNLSFVVITTRKPQLWCDTFLYVA